MIKITEKEAKYVEMKIRNHLPTPNILLLYLRKRKKESVENYLELKSKEKLRFHTYQN